MAGTPEEISDRGTAEQEFLLLGQKLNFCNGLMALILSEFTPMRH